MFHPFTLLFYVPNLCFIRGPMATLFQVIMSKTLEELIETAYDIKVYFSLSSYELHQYEDGSFVDFHVRKVVDLPTLIKLADGLELKFFAEDNAIIVRLFEKDCC